MLLSTYTNQVFYKKKQCVWVCVYVYIVKHKGERYTQKINFNFDLGDEIKYMFSYMSIFIIPTNIILVYFFLHF